jgi:hypothetical protein
MEVDMKKNRKDSLRELTDEIGVPSSGVRVKGQSKNRMEVSPRNIRFKSFANRFAILLQTRLPQSRRLTGCIASAIDALHYT